MTWSVCQSACVMLERKSSVKHCVYFCESKHFPMRDEYHLVHMLSHVKKMCFFSSLLVPRTRCVRYVCMSSLSLCIPFQRCVCVWHCQVYFIYINIANVAVIIVQLMGCFVCARLAFINWRGLKKKRVMQFTFHTNVSIYICIYIQGL